MENENAPRLNVLLAEDNPVTQDLLIYLLESNGHNVTPVTDGKMAVEVWEKGEFDIILMDVQMPEMDGIEAANIIREKEKNRGDRTPIIAVTAYALDECKRSCSSVGMDDFISKPINVRELSAKLDNFSRARTVESLATGTSPPALQESGNTPYDLASVREILAGDTTEMRMLINTFIEIVEQRIEGMKAAALAGDARKAQVAAHTIKGMSSQFGAEGIRRISREIEQTAEKGEINKIADCWKSLKAEFEKVKKGLLSELDAK